MDKLQISHDFAMKCVGNPNVSLITIEDIVEKAWEYADAMQAEADKRKPSGLPEALREEWQPDWSQAPDWAKCWVQTTSGETMWCKNEPIMFSDYVRCFESSPAPSFGYTGNWQDSLRKRPHDL